MRRTLRVLIGAVVALAVIAALAVVFLRQALLDGPVRQAAEARLSAALGQPVTIGEVGVSLFPTPAITGTDIHVGSATVEAPSVRLARIRIVPTLRSLFSQTIAIEDVRLEGFVVSVLHGRDGRWRAPAAVPAPGASHEAGVSIARVRTVDGQLRVFDETAEGMRERAAIDRIDADLVPDDSGLRLAPIRGRIGDAEITGEARADRTGVRLEFTAPAIGNDDLTPMLALLDSTRPPFLRLDKPAAVTADVHIDRASAHLAGGGTIRAPAVTLDLLHATDVAAPFTIEGPKLTFEPATFTLYGGYHRGTVTIALDREPARWAADSRVQRLDLGAFLDALAARDARIDGTARIDASVGGPVGGDVAATTQGRARLDVSDGVVHDFPLVAAINRALRLSEGNARDTRFSRLSASLAIGGGGATTSDLVLEAGEVRVAASGRIGFDRTLDLRGTATLSARRTAEIVASVHELARLRQNGTIDLPLTITGTLDHPAFGIDLKSAVERGIADELLRRLGKFIRR